MKIYARKFIYITVCTCFYKNIIYEIDAIWLTNQLYCDITILVKVLFYQFEKL